MNLKRTYSFVVLIMCSLFVMAQDDWRETFSKVALHIKAEQEIEDISADSTINIDKPQFAYVNIKGMMSLPTSKTALKQGWIEVYDGNGHYFKKRILLRVQGAYSVRFPKTSLSCDFCEKDWSDDYETEFKIGNWVKQSGFHFKAFYTDFTRGIGEIGYHVYEDVVADRDHFWERVGYENDSKARCFPDGFPCAIYFNGEFYGIYSWQLKKNHKNMNMKKTAIAEQVHLDGDLRDDYIFQGKIDWTHFEVRNPQNLYNYSNSMYDGNSPMEIMDSTSQFYDMITDDATAKEDKKRTALVKKYIINFSNYCPELKTLDSLGVSEEEFKTEFEKRFEIQSLTDYYVFHRMLMNCDGRTKNWQWFTYDGVKWLVTPYDLDQTWGLSLVGFNYPATFSICELDNGPLYWYGRYYSEMERQRYIEMRESGIFTYDNLVSKMEDWYNSVGTEYYALERNKWPDSPCFNDAICNANWEVADDMWCKWDSLPDYSSYTTYRPGDVCKYEYRPFRAIGTSLAANPAILNSSSDSLQRMERWVSERIPFLDAFYGYDPDAAASISAHSEGQCGQSFQQLMGVFDADGRRLKRAKTGLNIFHYSDGSSRKMWIK